MAAMTARLAGMPPRQRTLLLLGLLVIVGALLWLMLRAPLTSLRLLHAERARLELTATDTAALLLQKRQLIAEVSAAMAAQAALTVSPAVEREMAARISAVNRVAVRHGVHIGGATPGPVRRALLFDEMPVDVEARGGYQALMDWIADLERSEPTLAIVRFELRPGDARSMLAMMIRIASYRTAGEQP